VGRIGLAYFADDKGRIVTEMSVVRHRDDLMTLITAAAAEAHDFDWLARHLDVDGVTLTNRTNDYSTQILTGPASRAILSQVCEADLSQGWLTHQATEIAGRWARLVRVSFAGELGWEIHTRVGDTAAVFDAVWQAGRGTGCGPSACSR
jgi:dimethylglycine dehydrogenase